jgi:hypothetical protein
MTTESVASSTSNTNMNAHFHHHVIRLNDARSAIASRNASPTKHTARSRADIQMHLLTEQSAMIWFSIEEVKVSPRLSQKALSYFPWHRMSLPLFSISSMRTFSHQHGRVTTASFYITVNSFLSDIIPENPPSRLIEILTLGRMLKKIYTCHFENSLALVKDSGGGVRKIRDIGSELLRFSRSFQTFLFTRRSKKFIPFEVRPLS